MQLPARASHNPAQEVPDPPFVVRMMLPHHVHQRVDQVRLVGAPVVLIAAIVVEFLHPNPLPCMGPPDDTPGNGTADICQAD